MKPQFDEKRATQLACLLLQKRGGRMNILSLMKLMYLIDREALVRWGWSVTNDQYTSMRRGMVLSETYNLINEESISHEESITQSYWKTFISAPQDYNISLIDAPDYSEMSKADVELVNEIYEQYGHLSRFALIRLHHELPEWIDPDKSSIPVEYKTVLDVSDKDEDEISEILSEMEAVSQFEHYSIK